MRRVRRNGNDTRVKTAEECSGEIQPRRIEQQRALTSRMQLLKVRADGASEYIKFSVVDARLFPLSVAEIHVSRSRGFMPCAPPENFVYRRDVHLLLVFQRD
jgi:hypothetical protein